MTTTVPYGSWASPISVQALTTAAVGLSAVRIDGDQLYWLESHADQSGRAGLWRRRLVGGEAIEITPAPAYVRNRVHEYGGGEYAVQDGLVVYTEDRDGRVYRVIEGAPPQPLTPAGAFRYGDLRLHPDRGLVLAVREDHSYDPEPVNTIVSLVLDGPNDDGGTVLCAGADFYATPELSESGRLAWTQWSHPDMPWDGSQVMVGSLSDAGVTDLKAVAGGPGESAMQPRWLGDQLILLADRTGWWNLYRWDDRDLFPLHLEEAEFAFPQWTLGQAPYAVLDEDHLVCTICRSGPQSVGILTISTGDLVEVTENRVGAMCVAGASGSAAAVLNYPDRSPAVALLDPDRRQWSEVRAAAPAIIPPDACSIAEAVSWPGEEGMVHGWLYPPTNPEFTAPAGTRPPLLVLSHGGPTGFAAGMFSIAYQFWTSRGFAVLDVNYGGSAGFGRAYRERLRGQWGVVDARDCINGALAMVDQGRAEPRHLVIKGGSAGGYTTLRALTTSRLFTAGISQFGIGDLEAMAKETHKFESRYLDGLIGPYPQARETYLDRSPINHVDRLAAPILLLQGSEDRVVPPDQAEMMAQAARALGLPVALIMYAGEGHGFRRAETIVSATEAQLYFLGRIFGNPPADDVPLIPIDNLPG
jgi:dipeptidyl aminopeptidase/acylaminoacyl peptidase